MRVTKLMTLLAATVLIAGCGDKKETPKAEPPEVVNLVITLGPKSLEVDRKTLPTGQGVRVDYEISSPKKQQIQLINNTITVSSIKLSSKDKVHVVLQPLSPGQLTVVVGSLSKTIKVTQGG
jgi:uncharacterized lipoprotein YajG